MSYGIAWAMEQDRRENNQAHKDREECRAAYEKRQEKIIEEAKAKAKAAGLPEKRPCKCHRTGVPACWQYCKGEW